MKDIDIIINENTVLIRNYKAGEYEEIDRDTWDHIVATAARYDDLILFKAETGWVDWMNNYTTAAEDEPITESESAAIDAILDAAFFKSRK